MGPHQLLVEMTCSTCKRLAKVGLNYDDLPESQDHRTPNREPCRELRLGCKDCRKNIRIFIPEFLVKLGNTLTTNEIERIQASIIVY